MEQVWETDTGPRIRHAMQRRSGREDQEDNNVEESRQNTAQEMVKAPKKEPQPWIGLLTRNIREENGRIVASGLCLIRFPRGKETIDTDMIRIDVPFKKDAARISFGRKYGMPAPKGCRINTYRIEFDIDEARDLDIQNKLLVEYKDKYEGYVVYNVFDLRKGRNKNSRLFVHDGVTMYFRQNKYNRVFLTVRDTNRYDSDDEQKRIARAKKRAKALKDRDIVLLYEKKCQKYEESASVLYEKLIDAGYDNVFFIVDKTIPSVQDLPEKYKKNLIDKDSDKHLEYFFASDKFISTETIDHALQLRIANKDVLDKVNNEPLTYIFLQHGPTYMVSLNADLRNGFRKKTGYKLHKTVVSSELEAQHFIDLAGMTMDDLYVTGMAKFDRSVRNEGADRIIIMPTWRRWETNQAREDLTQTNYYRMICRMYNAVPEELRDKVIILPHPLMAERFAGGADENLDPEIGRHLLIADNYDKVLRDCDLLITDYSSISYDAFYRGANVIFCWEEKDECMTHYGEGTRLMLTEDLAFGPVTMNDEERRAAVLATYGQAQKQSYIDNYRQIIAFHDGKNSDRIIQHLIEDGVLPEKPAAGR